jgi:hypothetical protein
MTTGKNQAVNVVYLVARSDGLRNDRLMIMSEESNTQQYIKTGDNRVTLLVHQKLK